MRLHRQRCCFRVDYDNVNSSSSHLTRRRNIFISLKWVSLSIQNREYFIVSKASIFEKQHSLSKRRKTSATNIDNNYKSQESKKQYQNCDNEHKKNVIKTIKTTKRNMTILRRKKKESNTQMSTTTTSIQRLRAWLTFYCYIRSTFSTWLATLATSWYRNHNWVSRVIWFMNTHYFDKKKKEFMNFILAKSYVQKRMLKLCS